MRFLSQFQHFDIDGFLNKKKLVVIGFRENKDYETEKHLGTTLECLITEDETPYKQKEGQHITNQCEKLALKVNKDVDVPLNSVVKPINAVGCIYGDYRNQLSVRCDDVQVVSSPLRKA